MWVWMSQKKIQFSTTIHLIFTHTSKQIYITPLQSPFMLYEKKKKDKMKENIFKNF